MNNGLWCSGNTADFDSAISGSNPDSPATRVKLPVAKKFGYPIDFMEIGDFIFFASKEWGTVSTKAACFVTF